MSWNSAASRVQAEVEARPSAAAGRTFSTTAIVWREHVLVAVDRIVLEAHRRQLGQELIGEPGVDEEPQPGRRVVDRDQLVELVADALGRHDLQAAGHALATASTSSSTGSRLVAGDEAGRPQHPQRVVAEADLRRERRAQRPRGEVGGAAERVDERAATAGSPVSSSAIALTVKSRRDQIASMSSANVTCGLRESSV